MSLIFITGVPQLLFIQGVKNLEISKIFLVQPVQDEKRLGVRPFSQVVELCSVICQISGLDFESISLSGFCERVQHVSSRDYVDIQILSKLGKINFTQRPGILACQVEHINLTRPNLINVFKLRSLIKRYDLSRKLLFPNRIRSFYTLAPNSSGWPFLEEKILDFSKIASYSVKIFNILESLDSYSFLRVINKELLQSKVMIVLPLANHFGNDKKFNSKMFEKLSQTAIESKVENILIKNHPSDPTNYLNLANEFFMDINVINFSDITSRSFPLEILSSGLTNFFLAGVESTSSMILRNRVSEPTIIVDSHEHHRSKHQKYDSGEIRSLYENRLILI